MKVISTKLKAIIIAILLLAILISIPILKTAIRNYRITSELTSIAESHGLKDVKIIIGDKLKDHSYYSVTVDSSNLEDLTYSQMFSLVFSMWTKDAHVWDYTCNGNTYEIFDYSKSIYKNGLEIYDGYWNSQSHKDATKNDINKSDYGNSNNKSSSSSFNSYKSPSKKDDDKYNAKDYKFAEDFYEDHYDDFLDFYDAENYFNEHKD